MRCMIATLTAPWPERPQQGRYHLDLALAMKRAGVDATIFTPAPVRPPGLKGRSAWARRHAGRPNRYAIEGVTFVSPRVPFVHPSLVRHRLTEACPAFVQAWARIAMTEPLKRAMKDSRADCLLVHGALPWGLVAQRVAGELGIPYAVIEHSWGDVMRLRSCPRLCQAYQLACRTASAVVAVSSPMTDVIREIRSEPLAVHVPNGIDPAMRALGPKPPSTAERPLQLLSVAAYYRRKGLEELLEALALSLRRGLDARLTVVTRPPEGLLQIARRLGLDRYVTWKAVMSRQELAQEYRASDLFALPSWGEAFGLVYAESLACGTPVVMSSDCGLARDLPIDARGQALCGWVCPPRDVACLSDVLCEAGRDRPRLVRMGEAGRSWAVSRFDWDRAADQVLRVLQPRSTASPLVHSLEAA